MTSLAPLTIRTARALLPLLAGALLVAFAIPAEATAAPPNDSFAAAEALSGEAASASGTNVSATAQAGEPVHFAGAAGKSVWYRWVAPSTGRARISVCGTEIDAVIAAYTGSSVGALSAKVQARRCHTSFAATAGTTYSIAIDSVGAAGEFEIYLDEYPIPANDDFANATQLTGQSTSDAGDNRGAGTQSGEPGLLFAGDTGATVWYGWTAPGSGRVHVDVCDGDSSIGIYTGSTLATLSQVARSESCHLSFLATSGTTYRIVIDGLDGSVGTFDLAINQYGAPVNDSFSAATLLSGAVTTGLGDTRGGTSEAGEPNHFLGDATGASVWFRWTAPLGGRLWIDACESGYTGVIAAYTGSAVNSLQELLQVNDCRANLRVTQGTTYRIAFDGIGGRGEAFEVGLTAIQTPANDAFAAAQVLTGTFASAAGDTRGATSELGEPNHYSGIGTGHSVWYRWLAPASGEAAIDACALGGQFTPKAVVYSGSDFDSLAEVANNPDCVTSFAASEGATYRIAVDGLAGGSGQFQIDLSLEGAGTGLPQTTINSGPATGAVIGFSDPSFTFSSSKPGTFQCRIGTSAFSTCASPWSPGALADGTHTAEVRAIDTGGAIDPTPASRTFTIDTIAPETTIGSGPAQGATITTAGPVFTFSSNEQAAAFECKLDGGAFTSCTSPRTLGSLADGQHSFQVRAIDAAANIDATPASRTFTVDATAPETTITSGPAAGATITNSSPAFSFSSADPGAVFECKLDSGAFASCTSPRALSSLADGQHSFQVRAIDAAGNIDATPASRTFTVDATAPETTITSGPAAGATITNSSPAFSFSAEAGAVFECKLDSGAFASCTSPRTLSSLADGPHSFQVRAIDEAGNADATPASRTFTVDTTIADPPPETTIISGPAAASVIALAAPEFGFSSTDQGSAFECRIDSAAFVACTSPHTTSSLSEGSHTFEVRAIDPGANVDPSPASRTFTVDLTAPNTRITTKLKGLLRKTRFSFRYSASEPGSKFSCALDKRRLAACPAGGKAFALKPGKHTLTVVARDGAGNTDRTPAKLKFRSARPRRK